MYIVRTYMFMHIIYIHTELIGEFHYKYLGLSSVQSAVTRRTHHAQTRKFSFPHLTFTHLPRPPLQLFLVVALLIAFSCAHDDDAHAKAQESKKEDGHGNFAYKFDITNGIGAEEAGDAHNNVHGQYHFISKEGLPVAVSYTADEHGYHPQGDLLPTPPPTPEAILKALAYIDAHPRKEEPQRQPQPAKAHGHGRH